MDFSSVCRTCLATDHLKPIFMNIKDHKRYSTALLLTTGLKIDINDSLPQNMCTNCITILNGSLKFRRQSKEAERKLKCLKEDSLSEFPVSETKQKLAKLDPSIDLVAIKTEFTDYESIKDPKDSSSDAYDSQTDYEITDNLALYYDDDLKKSDPESNDSDSSYNIPLVKIKTERKRVKCRYCLEILPLSDIDDHIATNHPVKEKQKKNSLKGNFSLRKLFKKTKEVTSIRSFLQGLKCSYCDTVFASKEEFVKHDTTCIFKTKLKRGVGAKKLVECHLCDKKMLKASLKLHIRIKHAGLGPVCEHCGKKVHNNFRLEEHYRAKHGYEKFKCSICDFETASSYTIRDHERRHRGEKPFVCESCGAKFHAAYLLTQHKQSHRTEKPYKCDICPGSFKTKNSLLMHKGRCHSNLQYKCSLCDRVYPCRRYAVKHMRATHKFEGKIPSLQTLPRKENTLSSELNDLDT